MRYRPFPATVGASSELGLEMVGVSPTARGGPAFGPNALRRATDAGVTLFSVSAPAPPAIDSLATMLGTPPEGRRWAVVCRFSSADLFGPDGVLPDAVDRVGDVLRSGHPQLTVAIEVAPRSGTRRHPSELARELADLMRSTPASVWGLLVDESPPDEELLEAGVAAGARWLDVRSNLLNPEALMWRARRAGPEAVGLLVRDPFSQGRLDGQSIRAPPARTANRGPPPTVEQLSAEWAPVLRLNRLTDGRTRTLPQAALQYLLEAPPPLAVVVEPHPALGWEELLAVDALPPLSPEQRAWVEGRSAVGQHPAPEFGSRE